ncbi:hypothetical protein [Streptomyces sp. NPDC001450]
MPRLRECPPELLPLVRREVRSSTIRSSSRAALELDTPGPHEALVRMVAACRR